MSEAVQARGWEKHFRGVFGSPASKEENLRQIAELEACEPEDLVHVGDGANDAKAAAAFGCAFIGVEHNGRERAEFAHAVAVVKDMREAQALLM